MRIARGLAFTLSVLLFGASCATPARGFFGASDGPERTDGSAAAKDAATDGAAMGDLLRERCDGCSGSCCSGVCLDTQNDANHCGGCNSVCAPGETCSGGQCVCGGTPCGPQATCCGGTCVNTDEDGANCGGCGMACGAGEICSAGSCSCGGTGQRCLGGQVCCLGFCADVANDPSNCGACNKLCAVNERCSAGQCTTMGQLCGAVMCRPNEMCLANICVPSNCNPPCPAGKTCIAGAFCL